MNVDEQKVPISTLAGQSLLRPLTKSRIINVYNENNTKIAYKLDTQIVPAHNEFPPAEVAIQNVSTIGPFKELTISKIPSEVACNSSLLLRPSPLSPPPLIPLQFQTIAGKSSESLEIKSGHKLLIRKSVQTATNTNISLVTSAPSAMNSLTVNNSHANRTLVYRKPVTTKDTAPSNNCNEIVHYIDLTEANAKPSEKTNNCAANQVDDGQSTTIIKSSNSLLAANFGTVVNNERVTDFKISTNHKQYLRRQYINRTTSIGHSQFPHVKDALHSIVGWVSNIHH